MIRILMFTLLFSCASDDAVTKGDAGSDINTNTDTEEPTDYSGGWPSNPTKDDLGSPAWTPVGAVGDQVPRFIGVDQYGDMVDLYDFAGHGVPIVIDMGTSFCAPCKDLAAYLSDGDMSHLFWDVDEETGEDEYYPWWKPEYEGLRQMIADGDIYWITVLFNESESGPASQEECEAWHDQFPNPYIPVLADADFELKNWLGIESYPTLNLVNSDMVLQIHSTGGPFEVLRHIGELLQN